MILRQRFAEALKDAMRSRDQAGLRTVRLMLAALKDRDIAVRDKGVMDGIKDDEIALMLQSMIKQRHEAIRLYDQGGRAELAQQERDEIAVIEHFLPKQLDEVEAKAAIDALASEFGAASVKDMGRIMAALRERYAGQIDFSKASAWVKERLNAA